MEESERYCRKCELAKQYGGGLEEYLLRYLAQLTPEEAGRRCDVCKASGMLWEMHMVWGAYVPCLRMLCAASCCGKGQNCPYEKWEQEGETHDTRSGNIL